MPKLIITGGRPLRGSIRVNGAKNACLPIMAAAIMTEGATVLQGAPRLTDVRTLRVILEALGVNTERVTPDRLRIQVLRDNLWKCPHEPATEMRGSICVLGPLLARRGRAEIALPGGCALGERPIDLLASTSAALTARRCSARPTS